MILVLNLIINKQTTSYSMVPKSLLLVLSMQMIGTMHIVCGCLTKGEEYGDTLPGATTYDDEANLIANFRDGMIIKKITMCENSISGNSYLTGIQIDLLDRTTYETTTGTFHGTQTGSCTSWEPAGRTLYMQIGLRRHYSISGSEQLAYVEFKDEYNQKFAFGSQSNVNGGMKTNYDFNTVKGGMIGVFGTFEGSLNSLGPYSNPGLCTCADTNLLATTVPEMAASVSTGTPSVQTIPIFPDSYNSQGRGSCGAQTYSVVQSDGSSCADFLAVSGNQLVLGTSQQGLVGQYTIRITVTLSSYPSKQITQDFKVYLLKLTTGPAYQASKELPVWFGPYTTSVTCVTEPDFGFTLSKDMQTAEGSLPAYVTYQSASLTISANPQDKNQIGETYSTTFSCTLDQWVSQVTALQETVSFKVVANPSCPDAADARCPSCPDPTDTSDVSCPGVCPDASNSACPKCPDPSDTTDITCPGVCPDATNSACPICPDPSDTTDITCPNVCPNASNPACPVCPDPTDTSDTTCPQDPVCPDASNPACPICPDPTDTSDTTCPQDPVCPDASNPACPVCPDPSDTSDTTCPQDPVCPNASNPSCPVCPDPNDATDPTCPKDPTCPDPTNAACSDSSTNDEDKDENSGEQTDDGIIEDLFENNDDDSNTHPDFFKMKNHDYYISTGIGPILEDVDKPAGNLRSQFVLKRINQRFTWKYFYRNENPIDDPFKAYWGENVPVDVRARLECEEVSFFVQCRNDPKDQMIYLHSDGLQDESLLGTTFYINVYLINEIEQRKNYTIEIITLAPFVPDDENDGGAGTVGEGGNEVEVEELPIIEQIEVEYAVMNSKGRLLIKFAEFEQLDRRDLKGEPEKQLQLLLSLNQTKNGLDSDVTQFKYEIQSYEGQEVEVRIDFECPECISSFETDVMTITGMTTVQKQILFTHDVDVPPQVDPESWLIEIIELAAFATMCAMAGTILVAFLLDLILFQTFRYQALWQAVEVWQQVCYVQLLGVPLPGYALLYAPYLMPAVNFDVFHFLEKYWRDVPLFDYMNNEQLLGINFVKFGFDSVHFFDNTRSALGLTAVLLFILSILSWKLKEKRARSYMSASILVLLKSVVYYVLIISAVIQLRFNGDDGLQTALAILTLLFIGAALFIYFFTVSCKAKRFPTRQDSTLILRVLTCVAVVYGTDYPEYQFIALEAIHVLFITLCVQRFNKYQTARSLGLLYSYGMLPILIFSLRFDESGISPAVFSAMIIFFSTVVHVWSRDWVYRGRLTCQRKRNLAKYKKALQNRRKLKAKKLMEAAENLDYDENEDNQNDEDAGQRMGTNEAHDFDPEPDETDEEQNGASNGVKYMIPLMRSNKIMPIMEEPSSESEKSSKKNFPHRQYSVRSADSYGFQPKNSALRRTTIGAPQDEHRMSLPISAIEGDAKKQNIDISFQSKNLEGRSNFNEDLLLSSLSEKHVAASGEKTLKARKNGQQPVPKLDKDVEVSIDIDWPVERIEEEYRNQQTQKMKLLFGPNWEYQGEALDHDKAKKEIYRWVRDEEKRRSIAVAQAPDISVTELQAEPTPGIAQWVEETLAKQARKGSQFDASSSLDRDSLVQEIMGLSAYQSVPVSRIDGGNNPSRKYNRVNTASIDFYLSNPSSPDIKRELRIGEKKVSREPTAKQIQMFNRGQKEEKKKS